MERVKMGAKTEKELLGDSFTQLEETIKGEQLSMKEQVDDLSKQLEVLQQRILGKEEFEAALKQQTHEMLQTLTKINKEKSMNNKEYKYPQLTHTTLFSMKWVVNLPIKMIHPDYRFKLEISALYSGETLSGKPHGLGQFTADKNHKGFGEFINGKLHGRACWQNSSGARRSCTYEEGVEQGFAKWYYKDGRKGIVNSQYRVELEAMAYYAGGYKDGRLHGKGAIHDDDDGRVFVGEWESDKMREGVMSYLNKNNTRTLCKEKYNDQQEEDWWFKQNPYSRVRV